MSTYTLLLIPYVILVVPQLPAPAGSSAGSGASRLLVGLRSGQVGGGGRRLLHQRLPPCLAPVVLDQYSKPAQNP